MKRQVMMLVALVMILPIATVMAFHPTTTSCNTCHVTHNSQGGDIPLWSGKSIVGATFLTYESDTFDGEDTIGDPTGSTLLCLACHDQSGGHYPSINAVSGDLRFSHPVDFVYDDNLVGDDDELRLPSTDTVIRSDGEGGTIAEELLGDDKVKCISCHDVHVQGLHGDTNEDLPDIPLGDDDKPIGNYDIPHLQDIDGIEYTARGSSPAFSAFSLKYGALCITCHIK